MLRRGEQRLYAIIKMSIFEKTNYINNAGTVTQVFCCTARKRTAAISQSIVQSIKLFYSAPIADQRAGQLSLPHVGITKQREIELKHKNRWASISSKRSRATRSVRQRKTDWGGTDWSRWGSVRILAAGTEAESWCMTDYISACRTSPVWPDTQRTPTPVITNTNNWKTKSS